MLSHYPAKFRKHRHCGSGDMMLLMVEGHDSTCPQLNLPLLYIAKVHGMSCSHTRNFKNLHQKLLSVRSKQRLEGKGEEEKNYKHNW